MARYKAGFYWVKCRREGRWEVVEFDGIVWLGGPGDGEQIYIIGTKIREPRH